GCLSLVFFFFQAEDGIRAGHVTGVQTCALPISATPSSARGPSPPAARVHGPKMELPEATVSVPAPILLSAPLPVSEPLRVRSERSEERRVGKEWRCRGWRE